MTSPNDPGPVPLLPAHLCFLRESGIASEAIAARGYRTVTSLAELQRHGFGRNQGNVPAVLIPIHDLDGEVVLYQIRPDTPRVTGGGRPARYEVPRGAKLAVDVPPAGRERVRDIGVLLFVCHGVLGADAAASQGAAAVALLNSRGWRHDRVWDRIPLSGRRVAVVLDSSAGTPDGVREAGQLAAHLAARGAEVRVVVLPAGSGGRRQNLDDYLAAGQPLMAVWDMPPAEAPDEPLPAADALGSGSPDRYRRTPHGLCQEVPLKDGTIALRPLTNCDARIVAEVTVTDGVESHSELEIEATVAGEARRVVVRAEDYSGMEWVTPLIGPRAVVYAGVSVMDHARAAIQLLSDPIPRRTVYGHLGWVRHEERWWFLHAGGAIGADGAVTWAEGAGGRPELKFHSYARFGASGPAGPVPVSGDTPLSMGVRAPEALRAFRLPVPPPAKDLAAAVRYSLGLTELAPDPIALVLLAATYRAPLGGANYSLSLDGLTGRGKTTLAALFQQHFGPEMDGDHLPAGWASTANFLESLAFHAKDVLLVVDDLVIRGSQSDVDRTNREADRFLRGHGNRIGRGRCAPSGTARPARASRCLPLCTQEAAPGGHSLNARIFRLAACDLNILDPDRLAALSGYQFWAREGILASAMAGYLAWLAADLEGNRAWHAERRAELVAAFREDGRHPRTAVIAADLAAAFNVLLEFAAEVGAITAAERDAYWDRLDVALGEQVADQHRHLRAEDPVDQFLDCLHAALVSRQCHVALRDGTMAPGRPGCWGWKGETERVPVNPVPAAAGGPEPPASKPQNEEAYEEFERWRPCGARVGWVFDHKVYLLAEKALGEAQRVARDLGVRLPIQCRELGRLLAGRDYLAERDLSRGRYTKRFNAEGGRHNTICLAEETLMRRQFHSAEFAEDDYDGPEPGEELWGQDDPPDLAA